jgi:uncharacterized membrane-anchored protein YitT (DUF2179 family)
MVDMKAFNSGIDRSNIQKISKTKKFFELLNDALFYVAGCTLYAISVTVFTAPNKIAPGGITGISTILHYLFNTPIGTMIFILNIPLFILGLRFISGRFIIRTIICTAIVSVLTDVFAILPIIPQYHGNMLLAALYGGLLAGIGLGLVFLRGSTTGGTDIASRLIKLKFSHIPMGRMMMFIDAIVITISAVVFRSVDSGLYALIAIFTASKVIDSLLYGSDTGRMVLVISEKNDEIAKIVITEINRGVTMLKGRGVYTGRERDVLMCAVRRPQAAILRKLVRSIDPTAFIIMCEAGDVIGEGFKPISKDD